MIKPNSGVTIIGGGLAGSEAAWQLAQRGIRVTLHEMRPTRTTQAHVTGDLAELVCSNSFRSDDAANNAVGLMHAELRRLGSLIPTAPLADAWAAVMASAAPLVGVVDARGRLTGFLSREHLLSLAPQAAPRSRPTGPLVPP